MPLSKLCALGATLTLVSASAAIAQTTQVNVTDPTSSRKAHVEVGGRLAVQEVPPTSYFHAQVFGAISASGCVVLATAPSGKALIVSDVRVSVYSVGTTGPGHYVAIYNDADCGMADVFGEVNPGAIGLNVVPFGPGMAIPAGGSVSVRVSGSPAADVYLDGYTVPSSVAPPVGQTIQTYGTPRRQLR